MRPSAVVALAAAALVASLAPCAFAQSAADQATAEALFKQARELMAAGRYADACPKLAESERLDPSAGTLLNLATCYEKNGQIASAWVTYKEAATAAQRANEADRAKMARGKAAELETKLPTLVIAVAAAADQPGLVVKRDGEVVGRPAWGTAIPVDPGSHDVEASAPGHKPWSARVDVAGPAARVSVEVPALPEEAAPAPARGTATAPTGAVPPQPPSQQAEPASPGATQRVLAIVAGGAGVAGLAVGGVFGFVAKGHNDDAAGHCAGSLCDAAGIASLDQARSAATVSTVGFIAGGALLAGGVVLWLTAPSAAPNAAPAGKGLLLAPDAARSFAGLTLRGAW